MKTASAVSNNDVLKVPTLSMSRDEWLAERRKGIGGSDVAAILGLNPYRSPMAVYLDKIGEVSPQELTQERVYWGNVLEDVVARHYASVNKVKVKRNNHILARADVPFMIANLDREVYSDTEGRFGFEAKTTDARNAKQWEDDSAPLPYVLQVQHYMAVTGFKMFDLCCLIGGNNFQQRRINRDEDIISTLIERESEFWERVETKTPPAWDGSQSAWDVLKLLYPQSVPGKVVPLPLELQETLNRYKQVEEARKAFDGRIKDIEKEMAVYKQELCAALGDAEVGILNGMEISYKTVKRKGYTTKDTEYRSFKIKEIKDMEVA